MSRQQDAIKRFMRSLDNATTTNATTALNNAVVAASNGKFTSWSNLVTSFTSAVSSYAGSTTNSAKSFLKTYCGIDLDNSDTGAITGYDAGGTVKTNASIVPETGTAILPTTTSTTYNGLTVYWPNARTASEANVLRGLYSWWVGGAVNLISQSYGMSFNESDVASRGRNLSINFVNKNDTSLASTGGDGYGLIMNINMRHWDGINISSGDGVSGGSYLDRTIAHEMTHAVMFANVSATLCNSLPSSVMEGLAELTHGVDDERYDEILDLAKSSEASYLRNILTSGRNNYDSYAGGYMLLRYLAHQTAIQDPVPIPVPYGTSGNDYLVGTSGNDTIHGLAGKDTIHGLAGNDVLYGEAGDDFLEVASGSNTLEGGDGKDTLWGGIGNDYLVGGAGNDSLNGHGGSNTLYGGKGNDVLIGASGVDIFRFYSGDGNDTITNFESNKDVISLYGVDYSWTRVGGTQDVKLTLGSGSVLLKNVWGKIVKINDRYGNDVTIPDSDPDPIIYGTSGNDNLVGTSGNDTIHGLAGKDTIHGLAGNDILYGEAGNDFLEVASGSNTLEGGDGKDTLWGGTGNDYLVGGAGNDSLNGHGGSNIIYGGKGNDVLIGGSGIDTFRFYSGDGNDTITNFESNKDVISLYSVDYSWTRVGSTQDVKLNLGSGSVLLKNVWGKTAKVNDRNGTLKTEQFTASTPISTDTVSSATNRADNLIGTFDDDIIHGLGGNDTIYGLSGDDKLYGDAGNDFMDVSSGNNTLDGGAGKDTLWGGTGNDSLFGGAGNDSLNGFSGSNTLRGGAGNDTLKGGSGVDKFSYTSGDGNDVVTDFESNKDIIDLWSVNYSWSRVGSTSDVRFTLGSGSMILKDAWGKTAKVNDRYGTTQTERFVSANSWSLDNTIDSVTASSTTGTTQTSSTILTTSSLSSSLTQSASITSSLVRTK